MDPPCSSPLVLVCLTALIVTVAQSAHARTVRYDFRVEYANVTRLCHTKALVSVNGEFPGPTINVREGDTVIVNVTNLVPYNMTIHWHGVRQFLSAWSDGPAYITQCPIQTNHSFKYKFQVVGQRGTLFWHAHISWLRATVHGAFIIGRNRGSVYPFKKPASEFPLIIGEWWNANVEDVIAQALAIGGGYNISDAITFNGQPGALYNCSLRDTTVINVTKGDTYLLRIINAAVNFQMYVGISNHTMVVVAVDGEYTRPLKRQLIVLAPGQTTDVLLTANQAAADYYIAASVFSAAPPGPVPYPRTPATAILRYVDGSNSGGESVALPDFPAVNDTAFVAGFTKSLRGYYLFSDVPQSVDEDLFYTVSYALRPCPNCSFAAFPGNRLSTSINNITFEEPSVSLLQAYYNHINGVYDNNFPDTPKFHYNFTGVNIANKLSKLSTEVKVLDYGANVQIVFQNTTTLFFESHPIHLHGQNFYIVGEGFGNYNASLDPQNFNLRDPPSRNTVAVPAGGWAAIRFRAINPGVWFMHCHFDLHTVWGMSMAFIVKNGENCTQETLPSPPRDLPPC